MSIPETEHYREFNFGSPVRIDEEAGLAESYVGDPVRSRRER